MVTGVPTGPEVGDRLVMLGTAVTVKLTALLARAATVTSTLPVAAPLGTGATMLVALQLVGVAFVPLRSEERRAGKDPTSGPVQVHEFHIGPVVRDELVWLGR